MKYLENAAIGALILCAALGGVIWLRMPTESPAPPMVLLQCGDLELLCSVRVGASPLTIGAANDLEWAPNCCRAAQADDQQLATSISCAGGRVKCRGVGP